MNSLKTINSELCKLKLIFIKVDIELSNKDHIEVDTSNFFEGATI